MKLIFLPKKKKIPQFYKKKRIVWGHSNICPWKISLAGRPAKTFWTQDSDKDGVIDAWDCQPFNKRKQGRQHEKELKHYKNEKAFFDEIEKKYPSIVVKEKNRIAQENNNITAQQLDFGDKLHKELLGSRLHKSAREFERSSYKLVAAEKLKEQHPDAFSSKLQLNKKLSERKRESYEKKLSNLYLQAKRAADKQESEIKQQHQIAWKMMGETSKQHAARRRDELETGKVIDPKAKHEWDERSKSSKKVAVSLREDGNPKYESIGEKAWPKGHKKTNEEFKERDERAAQRKLEREEQESLNDIKPIEIKDED